ncbi:hypothetical protein PG994_006564 [Apiospora phragmitis]|uniref:Uncharacterized protein n=1 Tax=Apiospora phragmitis TaxID=2905665 RepID=A0ABR1VJ89_9PEZI
MTSITADLAKLSEGDLRELILKLAGQDKSKTLLASAHRLALSILERNHAEQEQAKDLAQPQQQSGGGGGGGARYMRLQLSTPLPKVASADVGELAIGGTDDGGLEQYRDKDGKFVYHTGEAIFFPDSINVDGSVTGRYNWTCCGFDGAANVGCVSTEAVPHDRQMRVLSNMGFMVGLRALPATPMPGAHPDSKTSYFD